MIALASQSGSAPRAAASGEHAGAGLRPILLDAHGHFYPCFDAAVFLDSAAANFAAAAARMGISAAAPGHLLVASTHRGDGLAMLVDRANAGRAAGWRLTAAGDSACVIASRGEAPELVLIPGQQVNTAEGLEVLAIAPKRPVAGGLPLVEMIETAKSAGAIVVVPWGFGKWWFSRGRTLDSLIRGGGPDAVFLGDSACRPSPAPRSRLLRLGVRRGLRVLPGSDPLPLRSSQADAGRYGCIIDAEFDPASPAAPLRRALATPNVELRLFGRRASIPAFVRAQAALRLRRPKPPGGSA